MKDLSKMLEVKCDCSETIDWHELKDFQGGLKKRNDSDYEKMKTSILKYGLSFVVYYWNDGKNKYIIDGHNRKHVFEELEKEGYLIPPIPAIEVFAKDRAEAKQKLLRLNSQYGLLSKESVLEFTSDLEINFEEVALPDTTISFDDVEEPAETEGEDDAPSVNEDEPAVSQRGEIYELGSSLLMCGDSTDPEDVARLMNGAKADCVFSDPPYGMRLDTDYSEMNDTKKSIEYRQRMGLVGEKKYSKVIGDNEDFKPELIQTFFDNFPDTQEVFLWGADYYAELLEDKNKGSWIVWDKRDDNEQFDKMFGSMFELCWSKNRHKREIARVRWCGVFGTEQEFDKKRYHPTQKPIKLVEWFITRYTKKDDLIVDLYGGSGSTLIASEKNNRRSRLMEIEPRYCDVIRRRYTQYAYQNGLPMTSGCLE